MFNNKKLQKCFSVLYVQFETNRKVSRNFEYERYNVCLNPCHRVHLNISQHEAAQKSVRKKSQKLRELLLPDLIY